MSTRTKHHYILRVREEGAPAAREHRWKFTNKTKAERLQEEARRNGLTADLQKVQTVRPAGR